MSIKEKDIYSLTKTNIREMIAIFKSHTEIEEVILFGSRAKENYRKGQILISR